MFLFTSNGQPENEILERSIPCMNNIKKNKILKNKFNLRTIH